MQAELGSILLKIGDDPTIFQRGVVILVKLLATHNIISSSFTSSSIWMETHLGIVLKFGEKRAIFQGGVAFPDRHWTPGHCCSSFRFRNELNMKQIQINIAFLFLVMFHLG